MTTPDLINSLGAIIAIAVIYRLVTILDDPDGRA